MSCRQPLHLGSVQYVPSAARPARLPRYLQATKSDSGSTSWQVQYLYDGECPLRKPEVDFLKRLDKQSKILFVDISCSTYNPGDHAGITYEEAMGPPHAITSSGEIITNVEVYRRLYEAVGLGFVWSLTKIPGISKVVDYTFEVWADQRLKLTRRPPLKELVAARSSSSQMR